MKYLIKETLRDRNSKLEIESDVILFKKIYEAMRGQNHGIAQLVDDEIQELEGRLLNADEED